MLQHQSSAVHAAFESGLHKATGRSLGFEGLRFGADAVLCFSIGLLHSSADREASTPESQNMRTGEPHESPLTQTP